MPSAGKKIKSKVGPRVGPSARWYGYVCIYKQVKYLVEELPYEEESASRQPAKELLNSMRNFSCSSGVLGPRS